MCEECSLKENEYRECGVCGADIASGDNCLKCRIGSFFEHKNCEICGTGMSKFDLHSKCTKCQIENRKTPFRTCAECNEEVEYFEIEGFDGKCRSCSYVPLVSSMRGLKECRWCRKMIVAGEGCGNCKKRYSTKTFMEKKECSKCQRKFRGSGKLCYYCSNNDDLKTKQCNLCGNIILGACSSGICELCDGRFM